MRTAAPIKLKVYSPATDEGRRMLAQRVADVHADFITAKIKGLDCPAEQKRALADAIAASARAGK